MAEDEKIWIERTFKIGDIVKIDKAPSASSFYNPEYAIYPPYYTGKIGRVVRILINPYEKKFQYFSRFSYELQQIIEEKFTHNTKLYAVSIITILPKNRDYVPQPFNYTTKPDENILFESIGILNGYEMNKATEEEGKLYQRREEDFISQMIAEEI